jgi:uncharacterized protein (TIGR03032 family)
MSKPAPAPDAASSLRSVHTANFPALLKQLQVSLVVSTYQAGKVIVVRNDDGVLNTHFRTFAKPMGITADNARLTIGGANTVWEYRNMPAVAPKLEPAGKHDACYIPRRIHITGDIDIHELAWDGKNELWVINTRFCCLCTLDAEHSFYPRWRPPFVSALAPEDRCHLNGIAMVDGRPKYVTALGETNTPGGWRANKAKGGILMDIDTNEILLRGLSMPHSPRWYREKLWVLESGEGSLAVIDLEKRTWQTVAQVPGFTRGIDFVGPLAIIGLSQVRESAVFSGIPLVQRLRERTCGVWVVNIETGKTLGFLRFEGGVQEIFAVQALRGILFPELMEWTDPRFAHSYVLPDEVLADVSQPTEEEIARSPGFLMQNGHEFHRAGKIEEAIAAYRKCVKIQPDFPNALYNLGVTLGDAGEYAEARACLEKVVQAEPERPDAYNSLGLVVSRQRQPHEAISYYERAIEFQPSFPQAHFNLGLSLLQIGDYQKGFAECEWRWQMGRSAPSNLSSHPKWDGQPIPNKTLLILAERGAEDAIQFARYFPLAAERCKKLIVACHADLMPILAVVPGIAQLREAERIGVAEFDTYLPLGSLPHVFGTTLDTIPAQSPYVDSAALLRRKENPSLMLAASSQPRVGIAWRRGSANRMEESRFCRLQDFLPILSVPGVAFYSLQRGKGSEDLASLPPEIQVRDLAPQLGDLGDMAVVMSQLDLVIGVESPLVHLAGAMGRPVWTLLSDIADWRWGLHGDATPWYPTMRLYRQTQRSEWTTVMEQVAAALRGGIERDRAGASEFRTLEFGGKENGAPLTSGIVGEERNIHS